MTEPTHRKCRDCSPTRGVQPIENFGSRQRVNVRGEIRIEYNSRCKPCMRKHDKIKRDAYKARGYKRKDKTPNDGKWGWRDSVVRKFLCEVRL